MKLLLSVSSLKEWILKVHFQFTSLSVSRRFSWISIFFSCRICSWREAEPDHDSPRMLEKQSPEVRHVRWNGKNVLQATNWNSLDVHPSSAIELLTRSLVNTLVPFMVTILVGRVITIVSVEFFFRTLVVVLHILIVAPEWLLFFLVGIVVPLFIATAEVKLS